MNFSIKSFKTFRGREGHGFNSTLLADGKEVAKVDNDGNGGCNRYYWSDKAAETEFNVQAKAKHPEDYEPDDTLIDELMTDCEMIKVLKRTAKKGVIFVLPEHTEGQYAIAGGGKSEADIMAKYPTATILNGILDNLEAVKKALKATS